MFGFAFPCTFLGAPEAPLSQLGSQSLSAPLPSSMSFPFCTFSALGGNSGVPVPPTQWTGRGRGTLEVGFPSSTSGSSSSDHPLLLALGVVVLDGQTGLLEWGSISQKQQGRGEGLSHLPTLQETPQEARPLHCRVIEKPRVRYSVNVQSLMDGDWVPRKV